VETASNDTCKKIYINITTNYMYVLKELICIFKGEIVSSWSFWRWKNYLANSGDFRQT
jgi:hypothetical protein